MELKLKQRELKLGLYNDEFEMITYPNLRQHQDYLNNVLKDETKEYEETKAFLVGLGMSEKTFEELQKPDVLEVLMVLTGQKKI